ncbi:MAG TPA: YciI family protein [Puia sp.]|nr:YciI family protein [Puia sp.]
MIQAFKGTKNSRELFAEGQRSERAGQPEGAAAAYQKAVDVDPGNQEAVGRLLVLYRRMKDYRKELAVIKAALGAIEQRGKAAQEKWISGHPGAAKLGRQVLRSLGNETASAYGASAVAEKLLKRKVFVEKRIGGKKGGAPAKKKTGGIVRRLPKTVRKAVKEKREKEVEVKKRLAREMAAAEKKKAAEKEKSAAVKERAAEKKRIERQEAADKRKKEVEEKKAARKAEADARRAAKERLSIFVISLRYLVSLERIDAAMKKHMDFLDKHFERKDFLVSGRQVPRTGGIIIARGKSREAVERIMKEDPFVKAKMAAVDIVEFVASQSGKGLKAWTGV